MSFVVVYLQCKMNEMDKEKMTNHMKKRQPSGTIAYTVSLVDCRLWSRFNPFTTHPVYATGCINYALYLPNYGDQIIQP